MAPSRKSNLILALAMATLVAGCADYMNRRDTITFGAGNAPEANSMIQTINHFPANASDTTITVQP